MIIPVKKFIYIEHTNLFMKRGSYKEISDRTLIILVVVLVLVSVIGTLTIYFHINGVNLTTGSVITNRNTAPKSSVGQVGVVVVRGNNEKKPGG